MAESAVISLAFKLTSMLITEVQLLGSINSKVTDIINELNSMRAFLRRADAYEQSNIDIEQWVNEVRDLAFEAEDVIDDYINLNSSAFKNFRAGHDIAMKLQNLKVKFTDARARFDKYKIPGEGLPVNADWHDPQEDALFQREEDLVGIKVPRHDLIRLLFLDSANTHKVSVVGMGGLGKTTLVKQVYETAAVKNHFTIHAWITVSKNTKVEDLLKDLIKQICEESCVQWVSSEYENMKSIELKLKANALLKGKPYMIVLDDLQSVDKWDGTKNAFPDNNCRSRIVVTTRNEDVATIDWKAGDLIYKLEPLSSEDSWELFCKKAFKGGRFLPDFRQVSEKILKKCKGLPLAIVAIGGVLITNDTPEKWVTINSRLGGELETNDKLKSVYKIVLHSYHYLPHSLKPCFLYMGLFPEDQPIGRLRLLRLWVAEGFVEKRDDMTQEEVAETYLEQLIKRNMVQVAARTSDGRERAYTIHSIMREIILARARDEQFASVTECGPPSQVARRLSLHKNLLLGIGRSDANYSSLRSFLIFDVDKPLNKTSAPILYGGFRLLSILDLQGANLEQFPISIVNLVNLRYLSLKYTNVDKVPTAINKLWRLETLDLKCTQVTKLPAEILDLKRLSVLLVYHNDRDLNTAFPSKHGFKAPKEGMGGLKRLQKLCFIELGGKNIRLVEDIQDLSELQRLGIVKLSERNGKALCSSITSLRKLKALSVTSSKDQKLCLDDLNDPPPLERMYLTGQMASLPIWIGKLKTLVKIYLKSSKLHENPMETLESLPKLVHIELLQAFTGDKLCFKGGKLTNLKVLGLREFASLAEVTVEQHAMPNLENFLIQGCPLLKTLPVGIGYLKDLKVLDFVEMPEEVISTLQPPPNQGANYSSIKHIPQVRFSSKVNNSLMTRKLSTDISHPLEDEDQSGTDVAGGLIQMFFK